MANVGRFTDRNPEIRAAGVGAAEREGIASAFSQAEDDVSLISVLGSLCR